MYTVLLYVILSFLKNSHTMTEQSLFLPLVFRYSPCFLSLLVQYRRSIVSSAFPFVTVIHDLCLFTRALIIPKCAINFFFILSSFFLLPSSNIRLSLFGFCSILHFLLKRIRLQSNIPSIYRQLNLFTVYSSHY